MLPPDYLINRIDAITAMYSDLHTAILEDIARSIGETLRTAGKAELIPSTAYQIERLRAAGLLRGGIIRKIAKMSKMSRKEIRRLFEDAAITTRWYDNIVYQAAGLIPVPVLQSPAMLKVLEAGISKTLGSVERLTGTMATNAQDKFEELLNLGYNKVASGAYSYQQAISSAVDDLAREGVTVFSYESNRHINAEAAVRMNILTGINQTAAKITEETMRELGVSLVRTSAHLGARNKGEGFVNHESWQGKIFRWMEMDRGDNGDNPLKDSAGDATMTKINREISGVQNVGAIDPSKFKSVSNDIKTDQVIITDRQIKHIKERHPQDYERFAKYIPHVLKDPDYILEANKPNSAVLLKSFAGDNNTFQLILRLKTSEDPAEFKNSVISFWKIDRQRYENYIRNKNILYKSE